MERLINTYRMDKTILSIEPITSEPRDREYWLSRTDAERLAGIEFMRQALYGYDPATTRLQRVLEIVELGKS